MEYRDGNVRRYFDKFAFNYVLFSSDSTVVSVETPPEPGSEFSQGGTRYRVIGLGETRMNVIDGVGVTMRQVEVEIVE